MFQHHPWSLMASISGAARNWLFIPWGLLEARGGIQATAAWTKWDGSAHPSFPAGPVGTMCLSGS